MNRAFRTTPYIFVIAIVMSILPTNIYSQVKEKKVYRELWKEFNEAKKKDLPKSCIKICQDIMETAQKEGNKGEYIKAFTQKASYLYGYNDSIISILHEAESLLQKEQDNAAKMLLHSEIANIYLEYAMRHGYGNQATTVEGEDVADDINKIAQWSRKNHYDKILYHISQSYSDIYLLSKRSGKNYYPYIVEKWAGEYFDHDLLHVLHDKNLSTLEMISSLRYNSDEHKQFENQICNDVESLYYGSNKSAYILLRNQRITRENLSIEQKEMEYKKLLDEIDPKEELRVEVYHSLANLYNMNDRKREALRICEVGLNEFPKYQRISILANIKSEIEQPQLSVRVDNSRQHPNSEIPIIINHKNLERAKIYLYRLKGDLDVDKISKDTYSSPHIEDLELVKKIEFDLTKPEDYQTKTDTIYITAKDYGFYYLSATSMSSKAPKGSLSLGDMFCVSKMFVLSNENDNSASIVVVDSKSGNIIRDATVLLQRRKEKNDSEKCYVESFATNNGVVSIPKLIKDKNNPMVYIWAVRGEDKYMHSILIGRDMLYESVKANYEAKRSQLTLFTDRKIYRPGQKVYLKGILHMQTKNNFSVLKDKSISVNLFSPNGEKIFEDDILTNEYGSFFTEFIIPDNQLNGTYHIEAYTKSRDTYGSYTFRVEEYKRPTFEVRFSDYEGAYRLGDTITLKGSALAYSGLPISNASVKYTIKKENYFWRGFLSDQHIVKQDNLQTDSNGEFCIPLFLDNSNSGNGDGIAKSKFFRFVVECEVLSSYGETQSAEYSLYISDKPILMQLQQEMKIDKDSDIYLNIPVCNSNQKELDCNLEYELWSEKESKLIEKVDSGKIKSNTNSNFSHWSKLPSGRYLLKVRAYGSDNEMVEDSTNIVVYSVHDKSPIESTKLFAQLKDDVLYYGTSEDDATIILDLFIDGKLVETKLIENLNNELRSFKLPISKVKDLGIYVELSLVRDNQIYSESVQWNKPLPKRELKYKWKTFRDKLQPGSKQEWSLTISNSMDKPVSAELLAFMYDKSLDSYLKYDLPHILEFNHYRLGSKRYLPDDRELHSYKSFPIKYLDIKPLIIDSVANFKAIYYRGYGVVSRAVAMRKSSMRNSRSVDNLVVNSVALDSEEAISDLQGDLQGIVATGENIDTESSSKNIEMRSNFDETAFFYPNLYTDRDGNTNISFTLPQSLTTWRLLGFAHTTNMEYTKLEEIVVASKDFMITPNIPRFIRRGDLNSISSSLVNNTNSDVKADVILELFDPYTDTLIYSEKKSVALLSKESCNISFSFASPEVDLIGVRVVADSRLYSDGEQHVVPVLSDKTKVVESLSLPMRGAGVKEFSLESLFNSHSKSATNKKLIIEYTANPIWTAIMALPSLSEPKSDCVVDWSNMLYSMRIADYLVDNNPQIERSLKAWKKEAEAYKITQKSKLEINDEIKSVLLTESPWVLEAQSEREAKEKIYNLFDKNNIDKLLNKSGVKLKNLQNGDGGWGWYKDMRSNPYITQYILTQLIRSKEYTAVMPNELREVYNKAIEYIHREVKREYDKLQEAIKKGAKEENIYITSAALNYLYIVALGDETIPERYKKQYDYFLGKITRSISSWSVRDKAIAAIVLHKNKKKEDAEWFLNSLKEYMVSREELGMYFDFQESPWLWNGSKMSAQIAAIEAFDVVTKDLPTVEELKIWLLKQKQTQAWSSSPMTSDAIYALLSRGNSMLDISSSVEISIADCKFSTNESAVESMGYIKEESQDMNVVEAHSLKVSKEGEGISWGAVYATFDEELKNIKSLNSGINIDKDLFVKRIKSSGDTQNEFVLSPINHGDKVSVGSTLTSRIVVETDRDMDFVHIKDQRGACMEPKDKISGYRWSGRIGYYLEVKDSAINIFIDRLPKGKYIFEIEYVVDRTGRYEVGLSTIQSAYAPEFSAHSASKTIEVE